MRREINNLEVICPFSEAGCNWEGKFEDYHRHASTCDFTSSTCPLSAFGCGKTPMSKSELQCHLSSKHGDHLELLANRLLELQLQCNASQSLIRSAQPSRKGVTSRILHEIVETDGPRQDSGFDEQLPVPLDKYKLHAELEDLDESTGFNALSSYTRNTRMDRLVQKTIQEIMEKQLEELKRELKAKDDDIASLKTTVTKLEKSVRAKHAELEDRDFRLSLIENSNHDGSMIWKIPQFSQRKADAQNGKYTSIFSLPFYSGRYGYKMCLRLYIMGDGIGKGTHLSLFFVVMRGEFDNILQWPFTHKVTFKLINQAGGRDIVDTFQPDPMSSSFRKPKSDMNIASGCPRFVSHTELERGGFIVDDTIFIKCMIDTSTIRHP